MVFAYFLVVRFLFGGLQAGGFPALARVVADWIPTRQRGFAQGMIWTFSRMGGFVAPLLVLWLIRSFGGWETPWALVGVTLLSGMVQAIDLPARLAFVVDLVGREDLANAVALNAMVFNVARLIGPALADFPLPESDVPPIVIVTLLKPSCTFKRSCAYALAAACTNGPE